EKVIEEGNGVLDSNALVAAHVTPIEARWLWGTREEVEEYSHRIGDVDRGIDVTIAPAKDDGLFSLAMDIAGRSIFRERAAPVVGEIIVKVCLHIKELQAVSQPIRLRWPGRSGPVLQEIYRRTIPWTRVLDPQDLATVIQLARIGPKNV